MRLRRFALALLGIAAAALVAALPAGAKEEVQATLTASIPPDAPAGTQLKVAWSLSYLDEKGQQQQFGANGVFVRLRSASGADATEGLAPIGAYPTGEYEATVVVPDGGIGNVEIGLMGWQSDNVGTRRSDMLFPIANNPIPGPARVVSGAAGQPLERPDNGSNTWIFVLVAGSLSIVAVLMVALAWRRNASRSAEQSHT